MEKFDSKLKNLIALVEHMLHQNQIYSLENHVEDGGLSEITKSTSETNPSKSDTSTFFSTQHIT